MSRSVEEVNEWDMSFREVMVIDLSSLPTVHVFHTNTDPESSCKGSNVDVVTLAIHWVHFLLYDTVYIHNKRRDVFLVS